MRWIAAAVALIGSAAAETQIFDFTSANPAGPGEHKGVVEATSTATKDVYDVVYRVPEGELKGIAFVDEGSDTIYVSYSLDGTPGIVVLKQSDDPKVWSGAWHQAGKAGFEVWTAK